MTLLPADTPVTLPALSTVATAVVADTHGLTAAGAAELVKVVILPIHTFSVPVTVGSASTLTVAVIVQPLLLV